MQAFVDLYEAPQRALCQFSDVNIDGIQAHVSALYCNVSQYPSIYVCQSRPAVQSWPTSQEHQPDIMGPCCPETPMLDYGGAHGLDCAVLGNGQFSATATVASSVFSDWGSSWFAAVAKPLLPCSSQLLKAQS